jgi:hypothetical protein
MEQFNTVVNQNLGWVHENKYVLPVLSLCLGMYAALARPKLPSFIAKLFENPVFRLVVIAYIIYRGNKDPQLSLMIAAAFLITMHMINKQQVESLSPSGKLQQDCSSDGTGEGGICNKPRCIDDDSGEGGICNKLRQIEKLSSVGRLQQDGCSSDGTGEGGICNKPRQCGDDGSGEGEGAICNKLRQIEKLSSVGRLQQDGCPYDGTGEGGICNKPRQCDDGLILDPESGSCGINNKPRQCGDDSTGSEGAICN